MPWACISPVRMTHDKKAKEDKSKAGSSVNLPAEPMDKEDKVERDVDMVNQGQEGEGDGQGHGQEG